MEDQPIKKKSTYTPSQARAIKKWVNKNPDYIKARNKRYYQKHKERIKKKNKLDYEKRKKAKLEKKLQAQRAQPQSVPSQIEQSSTETGSSSS